ncbi:MAG TPA: hypothetical protein VF570_08790, partial [Pyrinomonadaceae bacterium]
MTRTHTRNLETLAASLLSLAMLLGMTPPPARAFADARAAKTPAAAPAKASAPKQVGKRTLAQLPSVFEENAGQAGGRVRFLSRGARH